MAAIASIDGHKIFPFGVSLVDTNLFRRNNMYRVVALIIAIFITGCASEVSAQQASPRAQALAAALDKNKYKKKEKHNIKVEIYVDIKNEPVAKGDLTGYSGIYEADDYRLELKVAADGSAEGSGYDTRHSDGKNWPKMRYALHDAHVAEAVLTATKVYENGTSEKLEAVFANRTVSSGTNADDIRSRETTYGIGFIITNKDWTNRAFLEKQ
jgi:hypothetical protein